MTLPAIRILLLADTHLGFDLPFHPRVERRRRGHDFFANTERALEPALRGEVDLVVHGGDLFYRTRVPLALVELALAPLLRVAETGVPVFHIPGNHERSRIPLHLWAIHPHLHVFDVPRTFTLDVRGVTVALSGFPFDRRARYAFASLIEESRYGKQEAAVRFLCIHGTVEGATVGPGNYTFRSGLDVIRGRDIPTGCAAVLAGHIHRAQVLTHDLRGRPLAAPVIYPGSVERTSFAEREERKGYMVVEVGEGDSPPRTQRAWTEEGGDSTLRTQRAQSGGMEYGGSQEQISRSTQRGWRAGGGTQPQSPLESQTDGVVHEGHPVGSLCSQCLRVFFHPLPAREMVSMVIPTTGRSAAALGEELRARLAALPPDAVVRIQAQGPWTAAALQALSAASLRQVAPEGMNVSVAGESWVATGKQKAQSARPRKEDNAADDDRPRLL